ncbi:MAG: hypothetical protein WAJ85_08985 [Candidatus Baltobacteraceae bacterium]|jgi:hypothetical protein
MSDGHDAPSPQPRTYGAQPLISGSTLTCTRCGRIYRFPRPGGHSVFCECGWHYSNVEGRILEAFRPRFG